MTAAAPHKVIARGVGSNAFSFVVRFAARISLLYIGASLYGAAVYGVFSLAVAVVELAIPLASLGLKRMVFPWLEEEAQDRRATHVVLDALLLAAVAGLVIAALMAGGALLLPDAAVSPQLRFALLALAPAVLGQIVADIGLAATRWTHRMRYEVTGRGIVEPYVGTAFTFAAWWLGFRETGMLIGYWAGTIAVALFALWSARHCLGGYAVRQWRPRPRALGHRVRALLPASGSDALTALSNRVDLYLVGLLLGDAAAGIYSVVRQLRTPILQVRQAFDGILVPLIARTMRADGDIATGEATAAATRVILTAQLAVVLFMAAAGQSLLALFGAQYVVGYAALVLLALSEAVNGAFGVSELIIYYRRPELALALNVVLIAIAAAAIPLLAPALGIAGAAAAMLLAAVVAAVVRRRWLKLFGVRRAALHALPPIIAAATGGVAGFALFETFELSWPVPIPVAAGAPPLLALAIYGTAVWLWLRRRPGVLSLARFRVS